jgi:hypothetical protein
MVFGKLNRELKCLKKEMLEFLIDHECPAKDQLTS